MGRRKLLKSYSFQEIKTMYYDWVKSLVGYGLEFDLPPSESYDTLIFFLHHIEYYWSVRMDENRAGDGKGLRGEFFVANFWEDDKDWRPYIDFLNSTSPSVSVFEMLAGFSHRMGYDPNGPYVNYTANMLFRLMLKHIGIARFTDDKFEIKTANQAMPDIDYIQHCVFQTLDRDINNRTGEHALWPTKGCKDEEIWNQYYAWVNENPFPKAAEAATPGQEKAQEQSIQNALNEIGDDWDMPMNEWRACAKAKLEELIREYIHNDVNKPYEWHKQGLI